MNVDDPPVPELDPDDPDRRGLSIQQRYFAELTCFGCGPRNENGLRLQSFPRGDDSVVATFRPWPEHDNGLGFLNGGIIATLLDCHSAAAMVLAAAGRGLVPDGTLPYVTAGIDVRYLRPSPLHEPVDLVALTTAVDDREMSIDVELWWQDSVRATAVATWKRWRPRPA
jgi:acyl-coenzyme A thioesterase PaaI-like protein